MSNRAIYLAGTGWASIFGLSFLATKSALDAFSPFLLLFLRFGLAAAALGAMAAIGLVTLDFRGKPRLPLALLCLFQPVLYFACETYGLRETASSTAGLILGALPAAVAALSVPMLKEKLSPRQVIGLCVSVSGVILIVLDGKFRAAAAGAEGADSLRGILLIVAALLSAALYNIYSRRASVSYGPVETTFAMMASGAAFFGLLALLEALFGGGSGSALPATWLTWGAVAYLGLLSSVLAFFLVNLSLSRLKASQASIFGTLTTLVALVAGVAIRGERLSLLELAGAVAVIGGVWATNVGSKHRHISSNFQEVLMADSLFELAARANDGAELSLKAYEGQVLLVVNTASKCGFTPQYEGLEALYAKYGDRGLVVLGFPCNQFGHQEPAGDSEIAAFCKLNFGVSFPLMSKIEVNGKGTHPVYAFLKKKAPGTIKWNFTKFLVGKDGRTVSRFAPTVKPEDLEKDIEAALSARL